MPIRRELTRGRVTSYRTVARLRLTSDDVELRQLRYFVAVAETRHFGRAARRLHIATPSLSQQIRTLERDLHVVLLDRSPRGVVLTSAGKLLLERARTLLAEADLTRIAVRSAGEHREHLAMRVVPGAQVVLGRTLRDLTALGLPGVEVGTALCHDSDATQAIRQQRADVAIVWSRSAEDQDLAAVTLREVPVRLAVPIGHRLCAETHVRVDALARETIVLFPRYLAPGLWEQLISHLLPATGLRETQVRIEPDLISGGAGLLHAVTAGKGLAPTVPGTAETSAVPGTAEAPADSGIAIRPLLPPLQVPLELVWREPARPALRRLIALLEAGRG